MTFSLNPIFILFTIGMTALFGISIELCSATDADNLQDTCPVDTVRQKIFINGFPCKNPANIVASDFKCTLLSHAGDTDNFELSATTIATAAEFPGLNTLGLSVARTDLETDGFVVPHSHPRASEILFVGSGAVVVGFVDTRNQMFQTTLRGGDVFVVPKGLLHYCLNYGSESAVVFSVLNSQNPGMVRIAGAMYGPGDAAAMEMVKRRLRSLSKLEGERIKNVSLL